MANVVGRDLENPGLLNKIERDAPKRDVSVPGNRKMQSTKSPLTLPNDYEMRKLLKLNKTGGRTQKRTRGKRIMKIEDILRTSLIESQASDTIIFESELMKYKPGLSINFISRWCQVTKSQFMYFKNQWAANCWLVKPIMIIPLRYIKAIQKVSQELEGKNKKVKNVGFQFEIFLKEEVDLILLARSNDCSAYDMRARAEEQKLLGEGNKNELKRLDAGNRSVLNEM